MESVSNSSNQNGFAAAAATPRTTTYKASTANTPCAIFFRAAAPSSCPNGETTPTFCLASCLASRSEIIGGNVGRTALALQPFFVYGQRRLPQTLYGDTLNTVPFFFAALSRILVCPWSKI